jgi:hypothetical protein
MRKILRYCIQHARSTIHPSWLAGFFAITAVGFIINYTYDLEDGVIDQLPGSLRIAGMFLFHSIPFLLVVLLLSRHVPDKRWYRNRGFWLRFTAGFLILALDRSFQLGSILADIDYADRAFLSSFLKRIISLFTIVLPLYVISLFFEREIPGRGYGLIVKRFDVKPYLILLLIAGTGIAIGGLFQDIQDYYPRYLELQGPAFAQRHDIPSYLNLFGYEFAYGIDFISVEMFFRGFLIYSFSRYFGPYVVFPMILTYAFLHFGKPVTEAVSSLFGGYVLGVISLNSKTIWGGVLIHVGIAWLMELIGYIYRLG